jgi:hypothetical protein
MKEPSVPKLPWDRAGFDELLEGIAHDFAPSRFAVVQELEDMQDGRVAAWGLAWPGRVLVADADGGPMLRLPSSRIAALGWHRPPGIRSRVVWVDPEPEPEPDD